MSHLSSHHTLPPFSDNIPTAPLITLNLSALESDSPSESDALFTAAKELGFFYLDLNDSSLGEDIVREAEELNKLQNEFFSLPYEVKDRYGRGVIDKFFAYRFAELDLKDEDSVKLRNESYNVRTTSLSFQSPLMD